MTSFSRIIFVVVLMSSCFAKAQVLSLEQMTTTVSNEISKLVPAENDSNRCLRKYTITSRSLPKEPSGTNISPIDQKDLGQKMTAAAALKDPAQKAAAMEKIRSELMRKMNQQRTGKTAAAAPTSQITAVVEYQVAGLAKNDVILNTSGAFQEADIKSNKDRVLSKFAKRFCNQKPLGEAVFATTAAPSTGVVAPVRPPGR